MIVAICSDKGGPGVTTLALTLGLVWPGGATVVECDPSGSDLTFRLRPALDPGRQHLNTEPSLFTLAGDARTGLSGGDVARYGQMSTLGVRVVPGPLRAERSTGLRPVWAAVAQQLAQSPDLVIADLGRVQPGHAAWSIGQAATVLLVLARGDTEGLYHVRERAAELAQDLAGGAATGRNPVAVVMLSEAKDSRAVVRSAEQMFDAAGLPIPVAGWMADDRAGVSALRAGEMTRALSGNALIGSVTELAQSLIRAWPSLSAAGTDGQDPRTSGPEGRGTREHPRSGEGSRRALVGRERAKNTRRRVS